MAEGVGCKKCGYVAKLTSRYCEKCGSPLFVTLDSSSLKNEKFIDVYNSIYNLLCDKSNPERKKFFPSLSEEILWQRNRRLYKDATASLSLLRSSLRLNPFNFDINPLYQCSASSVLAGYSLRVAEELFADKRSKPLDLIEVDQIITKYIDGGKKELGDEFLWKEEDIRDLSIKRTLFSEALWMNEKYLEFPLFNKEETEFWIKYILEDDINRAIKMKEIAFSNILDCSTEKAKKLISDNRDQYMNAVVHDFFFGYCLRLSENLMPY